MLSFEVLKFNNSWKVLVNECLIVGFKLFNIRNLGTLGVKIVFAENENTKYLFQLSFVILLELQNPF